MNFLRRAPWALFLVLSWAIARLMGAELATSSIPGLSFIVFGFVALVLEFMFSADISVAAFQRELGHGHRDAGGRVRGRHVLDHHASRNWVRGWLHSVHRPRNRLGVPSQFVQDRASEHNDRCGDHTTPTT